MNDDELRLLIRSAIQKHVGAAPPEPQPPSVRLKPDATGVVEISFGQYRVERSAGETECIIEPAVQCNHCGYCKCHGH
jgi:hypothetical protein